jgi:hypothetical protein
VIGISGRTSHEQSASSWPCTYKLPLVPFGGVGTVGVQDSVSTDLNPRVEYNDKIVSVYGGCFIVVWWVEVPLSEP